MADVEKLNIDSIIARLLEGKRHELIFMSFKVHVTHFRIEFFRPIIFQDQKPFPSIITILSRFSGKKYMSN
jgi:hypothetical protein